jgi:Uma2 family endonuclease
MTQAARRLSFEEYLNLEAEDGLPEGLAEFVDGELKELPPESGLNNSLANYLFFVLVNAGLPLNLVRPHTCEVEVPVLQPKDPRTRFPDLVVLRPEHLPLIEKRLTIRVETLPPQFVAEVVSPGDRNRKRDYERKREQYQARSIPEYWLIDPAQRAVTVLALQAEQYQQIGLFQGEQPIQSSLLNSLNLALTAEQIFTMR